ncbi:MAG: hypothetical protein AAGN66_13725 [Acidobacteriota bacterium]
MDRGERPDSGSAAGSTPGGDSRRLDDLLDGALTPEEQASLEARIAQDEVLAAEWEDLRHLAEGTRALPREIPPPGDLWRDVAAELAPRNPVRSAPPPTGFARGGWLGQAVAAALFMALGGVLTWLFLGVSTARVGAPTKGAATYGAAGEVVPASAELAPQTLAPQTLAPKTLAELELDYLRARDALWLAAYGRRGELSPELLEAVQSNLLRVDDAIRDLRRALDSDPGNPQLESLLLANHRRGVDLLWRLNREI